VLSVEFTVDGVPVSAQGASNPRTKQRLTTWRRDVSASARIAVASALPVTVDVAVTLIQFGRGPRRSLPDADNMSKPILDALQGIIFVNDHQIDDLHVLRRSLDEPFIVAGVSPVLAAAFTANRPFVYVRITDDVDRTVLP